MPTETTKLGGLQTAVNSSGDKPISLPSPDRTTSNTNNSNIGDDNGGVVVIDPAVSITTSLTPLPTHSSVEQSTAENVSTGETSGQVASTLPTIENNDIQRGKSNSNKRKPAPPPYPPPGYYDNKETFLDSNDPFNTSNKDEEEDDDEDDEDVEIQYFDTFDSSEIVESSTSTSLSLRTSKRSRVLPTQKRNGKVTTNDESEDDHHPPTITSNNHHNNKKKRKKHNYPVSRAKPKLAGAKHKAQYYDTLEPILHPTSEDILAGRGGATNRHDGNIRFRSEARKLRSAYRSQDSDRRSKYLLSQELVERVKQYGGRFLEKGHDGKWYEMDEKSRRKKASQVLREEKWE